MSPRTASLVLLALLTAPPSASAVVALPNVSVPSVDVKIPDMGLGPLLVPQAQAGVVTLKDGVLVASGQDVQVVAGDGAVLINVPWTINMTAGADGAYRSLYVAMNVLDGPFQAGADFAQRQWTTGQHRDAGALTSLVHLSGLSVRHVLSVYVYATWYQGSPYQSGQQSAVGSVVATGPPALVTNEVTTAPRFQGADFLARDARDATFQPNMTFTATFHPVTIVAPDRFAVASVPYRFLRDTPQYGYGYEYGYVQVYAYDERGAYLGGSGLSWYVNHDYGTRLSVDVKGSLDVFLQFQGSWLPEHTVRLNVYGYWYGYVCNPTLGCPWFSTGQGKFGDAGIVYAPPDRLPTADEAASTVFHLA